MAANLGLHWHQAPTGCGTGIRPNVSWPTAVRPSLRSGKAADRQATICGILYVTSALASEPWQALPAAGSSQ